MRILSFNWHTPYLSLLARLENHRFEIAPANFDSPLMKSWDTTMRPVPSNVTLITTEEALARLKTPGHYALVIAQNLKDIVFAEAFSVPKILVFHNKLSTEAELGKKPEIANSYREWARQVSSCAYRVFISETKRQDWDMPGEIIMPGVDVAMYGGYTGEIRQALRVGNNLKARDLMTGYSIQEEALQGFPNVIMGLNPDIPGAHVSQNWDELKKAYRENRLFLNTTTPKWEDGYNLAMLEAMATGMPVVTLSSPTTPITDGVDGFTGSDAMELRKKSEALLNDVELAKKLGNQGRDTVERLFPIKDFLDKWDSAIHRAIEWDPKEPSYIFSPAGGSQRASFPDVNPGGKKVILCYTSYPVTAAAYMERAFRKNHRVVTVGSKLSPFIINEWDLHGLKEVAKAHDIHTSELTVDINEVKDRLPDDADFLLWVETGLGRAPENLDRLKIPKAAYLIDTHIHLDKHVEIARRFDLVFLAQRAYIPLFHERGVKNVHWLPLACDPEIHGKRGLAKTHDVGFVGTLADKRRLRLLTRLAESVEIKFDRLFLREMADHLERSRIVFNNAIKDDLNMRVFEAMCAGSLLLTDNADGLTDFFADRRHLVVYDNDNAVDLAVYYLRHEAEREKIAETGRVEILKNHTYERRVEKLIEIIGLF
jgi:glycosyltransferase involved in cell wall biosynthesis